MEKQPIIVKDRDRVGYDLTVEYEDEGWTILESTLVKTESGELVNVLVGGMEGKLTRNREIVTKFKELVELLESTDWHGIKGG